MGHRPKQKSVTHKGTASSTGSNRRRTFNWKRIIAVVSLTIPLLLWMDHRGSFDELESFAMDVTSGLGLVTRNTGVVIVDINDHDYKEMFQSTSPLNPPALIHLIEAIAAAKPKAIGIDIVTDPAVWTKIQVPANVPIVWAYRPDDSERKSPSENHLWGNPKWPASGPVVRQYARLVPCGNTECPSLTWQIMKAGFPNSGLKENSEELTIRYIRDQNLVHAMDVLTLANAPGWAESGSPLYNKTVLLGGSYDDAHQTPMGRMAGVEIWANVLETEIDGGGYRSPPWIVLLILGFMESVVIVLMFYGWDFKLGLLTSIAAVPILSVTLSLMVYHNSRRWAYFAMILLTLIVEQSIELAREKQGEQIVDMFHDLRRTPYEEDSAGHVNNQSK